MFSDRNYNSYRYKQTSNYAVPSIILLCIIVFIIQEVTTRRIGGIYSYSPVTTVLALNPAAIKEFQVWRLVTYMFVHGGFWHLALNMWGVYLFGSMLERHMGSLNFLKLYFISGIAGAVFWLLFNWNVYALCIGASGALFGVMVGAAMLFPNAMLMLLIPPIPLKLKTFVLIYALIETFFGITGGEGQIAHLAHLGGLIGGYFVIRYMFPRETINVFKYLTRHTKGKSSGVNYSRKASKKWSFTGKPSHNLDEILDKISKTGINSLTAGELEALKAARDKMKSRRK
ncbi:MAG TPA: rhomboid family intramembrane serine protease [Victivallales bacterium]|nr:rhomboid family intramembrane serine protease [Victivallales bacterium]